MSKIFQHSKVPTETYILYCVHITSKINMSLIQTTCPLPQRTNNTPPKGHAPQSPQYESIWSRYKTPAEKSGVVHEAKPLS